jgi:hypothetical protein
MIKKIQHFKMKMGNGSVYLATDNADRWWNLSALLCLNIWIKIMSGTYWMRCLHAAKENYFRRIWFRNFIFSRPLPQVLNYWSTLIYLTNFMRIIFLLIVTPCSREDLYRWRSFLAIYSWQIDNMSMYTAIVTDRTEPGALSERIGTRRMV